MKKLGNGKFPAWLKIGNFHFFIFIFCWKVVKAALPAAGVAKLRDVTKNTFGQFVDEENRLGRQQIYLQIDLHFFKM